MPRSIVIVRSSGPLQRRFLFHYRIMKSRLFAIIAVARIISSGLFGFAQSPEASELKWNMEVHGGWSRLKAPNGMGALPPSGAPILLSPFIRSAQVSSWYFGSGSAAFNLNPNVNDIVPLDVVLTKPSLGIGPFIVGARLDRSITRLVSIELTLDEAPGFRPLSRIKKDIEATRASFIAAWPSDLDLRNVTSEATISRGSERLWLSTISLRLEPFRSRARLLPFGIAGIGFRTTSGSSPGSSLTGQYSFDTTRYPQAQTGIDRVSVTYSSNVRSLLGVFGGGVEREITPRIGVRADFRIYGFEAYPSTMITTQPTPDHCLIVTISSIIECGPGYSLGPPGQANFKTFSATGMQYMMGLTIGIFRRF